MNRNQKKYDDLRPREVSVTSGKQDRETQKNLSRVEKQIEQLNKKKIELQARFENPEIKTDDLIKWSAELKGIEDQLELKEDEWLSLSES